MWDGKMQDSKPEVTYHTVKEVATTLKVSESTVYNLLKSHELDAVRVGRSWRIPATSVQKYLQSNTLLRELKDGDR